MNSRVRLLLLVIFGLLLAALVTRSGDLAWLALPFLVYLAVGFFKAPSAGAVRLQAARVVTRKSGDETGIDVHLTIRNQGLPVEHLYLYDPLQEGMKVTGGETARFAVLPTGAETCLDYSIQEKRGSYQWEAAHAVVSDPFGLVEMEFPLPARADLQVQPERGTVRRLPLRPPGTLHSPGSIQARIGGSGVDFWGVREYHPGDSLRWLDWRLTARHPGQFFTKEFEQEEIADIGLILDARKKTDLQVGEESLFEHSVSAAASLAEAFLHQGHRVSLIAYNGNIHSVFPGYGKVQLNRVMRCLARIKPTANRLPDSLEYIPLRMFSSRALLVVVSPLVQKDWAFFLKLRAQRYQGLVVSPNPFDFITRLTQHDRTGQLALRAANLERALLLRNITQLPMPVIDWHVHQPLYPLVRAALGQTRGQRKGEGVR